MKIQFCGAARTVTGSCYYVDTGSIKFLVDCGAFQGTKELDQKNYEQFPFDPAELQFIFLTHAHFDHVGRLPKLVKDGFRGKIIATQPTRDLAQIVLLDAAHIQDENYNRWVSKPHDEDQDYFHKPLFDENDVYKTMALFESYPFGSSVTIAKGLEFRMRESGHILGSASFELWVENGLGQTRKIVFSGDIGQPGQRIVKDPDIIREADYVLVESTYGNRLHKSRDDTIVEFLSILNEARESKGNILIPTFAIERAQEILYELNNFVEKGLLKDLNIYLDSPMAKEATEIFQKYPSYYDEDARRLLEKGDDPFHFPGLSITQTSDDSKRLIDVKGAIIMAGSGMCNGGRIIHHLINNIEKAETHILIVGFQVPGTLGRRIMDGEPQVRIRGKELSVNAKVHTLGGFSAHADQKALLYWLQGFGADTRKVFLTHGEEDVMLEFEKKIKSDLNLNTYMPNMSEIVEIE